MDFVNVGKENEYLALRILVFETWIGFELPVKNILVKEVDVLRAQVIDAQEEITALKNKQAVQFISVRINAKSKHHREVARSLSNSSTNRCNNEFYKRIWYFFPSAERQNYYRRC